MRRGVVEIQGEITDIKAKKQNLETEVKAAEQEIAKPETTIDELKMAYENIVREYPEHASDVEKKYQDEREELKRHHP